jgi:uncharacterized protein with HEPN domain
MSRSSRLYLQDILESIERIDEYTKELDESQFSKNDEAQDAVMRRLEIIGEAVKNLPRQLTDEFPAIPWRKVAGMRDMLTHEYFGVEPAQAWKTIKADLIPLKEAVQKMLLSA